MGSWQGIFALSKTHRKTLEAETCVMSVAGNTHRFMCNPGTTTIGAAAQAEAAKTGYPKSEPAAETSDKRKAELKATNFSRFFATGAAVQADTSKTWSPKSDPG